MRTEPLDDESAEDSRQPCVNQDLQVFLGQSLCCSAATRGQSLSRHLRKPQTESVKKNLVIESCESICESFAQITAILLRWGFTGSQSATRAPCPNIKP